MPTPGIADAHRFERLMRRHVEGKLSDAQLIAAQEQLLGRSSRAGRAVGAATDAAGGVDPNQQATNPPEGQPSQGSTPWGHDPTTGGARRQRPRQASEEDASTKRPGVAQLIGFAVAAILLLVSRWLGG